MQGVTRILVHPDQRHAIVSVKLVNAEFGLDLELPVDTEVERLLPALAEVLRDTGQVDPQAPCRLEAHPPGRTLRPEETLASAGVWDGAWLLLVPEP